MSQRFLIYPLVFAALMQLAPLLRFRQGVARWYAVQIIKLIGILLACAGGFLFEDDERWVIVAWGLFLLFVGVPRLFAALATRGTLLRPLPQVARCWQWAGWFTGGRPGQLFQAHAQLLRHWQAGDRAGAETFLEQLLAQPLPADWRGDVRLWKLILQVRDRDYPGALEFYNAVPEWGTLGAATQARLLAARAFAETGQFELALRSLQFVALSPRTIGALERQLWMTRLIVAALAGDEARMEVLLRERGRSFTRQRGLTQFAEYWRGRCALVRGDASPVARGARVCRDRAV